MELLDALRTNPSVRDFTDAPVPDDVVAAILDDAFFAPSGGNRQPWRVAVTPHRGGRPVSEFTTVDRFDGDPFAP